VVVASLATRQLVIVVTQAVPALFGMNPVLHLAQRFFRSGLERLTLYLKQLFTNWVPGAIEALLEVMYGEVTQTFEAHLFEAALV